jgi:hypothetical protein
MADEHEGLRPPPKDAPGAANIANPRAAANDDREARGHSSADAGPGERRSFDPSVDAPALQQAADDDSSAAVSHDHMGPGGDPAEGKR